MAILCMGSLMRARAQPADLHSQEVARAGKGAAPKRARMRTCLSRVLSGLQPDGAHSLGFVCVLQLRVPARQEATAHAGGHAAAACARPIGMLAAAMLCTAGTQTSSRLLHALAASMLRTARNASMAGDPRGSASPGVTEGAAPQTPDMLGVPRQRAPVLRVIFWPVLGIGAEFSIRYQLDSP